MRILKLKCPLYLLMSQTSTLVSAYHAASRVSKKAHDSLMIYSGSIRY
jgi:hypothetical protein